MRSQALLDAAAQARATLARFPLAIAAAGTAVAAGILLVEPGNRDLTTRVLLAAILGLPTFTAVHLLSEERHWSLGRAGIAAALATALLLLFLASARTWSNSLLALRFAQLTLGAHLAVTFLPFHGRPETASFWQFNWAIFQRFLVATLFSAVLFTGLAIALVAIDRLLGIHVDGDFYPRLLVVIAFGFHPWYTLGGVPRSLGDLEDRGDYPTGLRIFAQYILIPIVVVYLAILTAYLGRVVVTRAWPSGWIGYLVSSVATAGTLALLLAHPARQRAEGRWIDPFARWFFIALIPSLIMALLAVGKRITQYGVTEPRYALGVLGWWLLVLAAYFAVTRSKSIRIIPVSLGLVVLVTAGGPWGMAATSQRSETIRFRQLVEDRSTALRSDSADQVSRRELTAVARYLLEVHGPGGLAAAIRVPADTVEAWRAGIEGDPILLALRTIGTEPLWQGAPTTGSTAAFAVLRSDTTPVTPIEVPTGSVLFPSNELFRPHWLVFSGDTIQVTPHRADGLLEFRSRGESILLPVGASIDSSVGAGPGYRQLDRPQPLVLNGDATGRYRIRLVITAAHWPSTDSMSRSASGSILLAPR